MTPIQPGQNQIRRNDREIWWRWSIDNHLPHTPSSVLFVCNLNTRRVEQPKFNVIKLPSLDVFTSDPKLRLPRKCIPNIQSSAAIASIVKMYGHFLFNGTREGRQRDALSKSSKSGVYEYWNIARFATVADDFCLSNVKNLDVEGTKVWWKLN